MQYFEGLPFFLALGLVLITGFICNVFQKSTYYLSLVFSVLMVCWVFSDSVVHLSSIVGFVLLGYALMRLTDKLKTHKKTMPLVVLLAGLPLILVKVLPLFNISGIGFLGISYMTFKLVQIIIEMYDGLIEKPLSVLDYTHFLLFFPALSSGPIDRSRRFVEDWQHKKTKEEYFELAGTGIFRLTLGMLYKIVLSGIVFQKMNALQFKDPSFIVLYTYFYTAYKDFWNRWHITLSTWLRDFVFSRIVMRSMRKKIFKKRLTTAMVAYMVNMTFMGLWHGVTPDYIAYGVYHGLLMAGFEW